MEAPSTAVLPPRTVSPLRAWGYLVWLSFQRQARARQMVWIALGLLVVTATIVALNTAGHRWSMDHWRSPRGTGLTFRQWLDFSAADTTAAAAPSPLATGIIQATTGACRTNLEYSGFLVFANFLVYSIFLSFLLPVWSLSFATEAIGSDRESRNLVWLLSRPLSRPAIYLAKYVALLPWALALNVGGFAVICLAAGAPGLLALRLFWPSVVGATFAFCALFHLMGATFKRAAVVAILYSFFLETFLGNLPGYMKRVSVGFYTRCLMFSAAEDVGVFPPEKAEVYWPVEPWTAWLVLIGGTLALLIVGMIVFARTEYRDEV